MNIMGKLLVILNLLAALATGGFLIIDYAARTNWKTAYESLKREMEVAKANTGAATGTMTKMAQEVQKAQVSLETEKKNLADQLLVAKATEAQLNSRIEEESKKAEEANLNHQMVLGEMARMKEEVNLQSKIVQAREKAILGLEDDVKKYRGEAVSNEQKARSIQERNEELLRQVAELSRKMAEKEAGPGITAVSRDPNQANPPGVDVKGVVEKVFPEDKSLVQISLGSDQGVNKGHTLEVYRLSPRPEYLGMIRIVETYHQKAIGRLVRNGSTSGRNGLLEGDQVASRIGTSR